MSFSHAEWNHSPLVLTYGELIGEGLFSADFFYLDAIGGDEYRPA